MPVVDILKNSYTGKQVQSVADLIKEIELGTPKLSDIFTVIPGIKGKKEVGYVSGLEKITRKDTGCGMTGVSKTPDSRKMIWNPEGFKIHHKECYIDWLKNWLEWGLKNGIKKQDLTTDDYFLFLVDLIEGAIQKDLFRYVMFGKKDHTPVGAGTGSEVLTAGELPEDFNIIDGFCALMDGQVALDSGRKFTITANAGINYAAQKTLADDDAFKAAQYMLDNADARMFSEDADPLFVMTWSMYTNLKRYMRETYHDEMSFSRTENGFILSEFDGVPIVTSRKLDEIIRRDFDNGTKWDRPHRAYLIDKNNEQVGIDSEESLTDIEVEYIGGDDEHNHVKASYLADFKRPYAEFGMAAF